MQAGEVQSLIQCIKKTFIADGYRGFFYGISTPLYTIPLVNAIVFGAYAQANYFLNSPGSFHQGILAGAYAGLINTIVVTPVELVKCRLQIQSKDLSLGQKIKYKNTWDCIKKIIQSEGL